MDTRISSLVHVSKNCMTESRRGFFYHMKNEMAKFFRFWNMKIFSYLKYEKFHLQIFSTIVHKNNLFLDMNVHYLSKKQPRTYFLSNLCKILDIFANEIFHISNMKKKFISKWKIFCHFVFHMIEKTSSVLPFLAFLLHVIT